MVIFANFTCTNLSFIESDDYSSLDDENLSESSISINNIKVNMEDLRQDLRGKFMNLVGNPDGQDKRHQSRFKKLIL